ncbi:hypothetical protein [Janthinobacterium sp. LB2P70]|uniref:hypothetical protein n=1 Tax=Janthinobacterium sp. LB2P70 TaxID=3424197 RepID=UPI003F233D85
MASIENRSHYQVSVKNRDDLTKIFPHDKQKNAEAYRQSMRMQKFKPKLILLDDHYMVRIRKKGHEDHVLYANSLKEAELVSAKLRVEHSRGFFVDIVDPESETMV